jgi:hypothetical protein
MTDKKTVEQRLEDLESLCKRLLSDNEALESRLDSLHKRTNCMADMHSWIFCKTETYTDHKFDTYKMTTEMCESCGVPRTQKHKVESDDDEEEP